MSESGAVVVEGGGAGLARPVGDLPLAERLQRLRIAIESRQRLPVRRASSVSRLVAGAEGADRDYGLDLGFRQQTVPFFRFLFERYWRVDVSGLENIPAGGGAILVGNHSGGIPFDGTMLSYALSEQHEPGRIARLLYDRFVDRLTPVASFYRKCGGVPARFAVADELLGRDELVVIFPEGVKGTAKLYPERYTVRPFATSAARLSLRHRVPIIPFAVVGAEEIYPIIGRSTQLGRMMGAPYLPITPFFPFFGLLGLIPLPTKWTIAFGKRIYLYRENRFRGPEREDFEAMSERLRRTVQILLRRHLRQRSSIFLG